MKNQWGLNKKEKKAMSKYWEELKKIRPYKKRSRNHTNNVWRKTKQKIYDTKSNKNK